MRSPRRRCGIDDPRGGRGAADAEGEALVAWRLSQSPRGRQHYEATYTLTRFRPAAFAAYNASSAALRRAAGSRSRSGTIVATPTLIVTTSEAGEARCSMRIVSTEARSN